MKKINVVTSLLNGLEMVLKYGTIVLILVRVVRFAKDEIQKEFPELKKAEVAQHD